MEQGDPVPPADQEVERARLLFAQGRLAEATDLCQQILIAHPGHPGALRRLAFIHVVGQKFQDAARVLEQVAPLFPNDAQIRLAQAETAWSLGGPSDAVPYFQIALAIIPDHAGARERLGAALLACGRPTEALPELERALALQPHSVAALISLARTKSELGEGQAAVDHLKTAYELDQTNPDILFQLGMTLRGVGLLERAVSALREAVNLAPGNAVLRVALGEALRAHGDHAAAIPELTRATELNPGWAVAWSTLGDVLQASDRRSDAITAYRRAIACHDVMPEIHALLANALHDGGEVKAAAEEYAINMQSASWAKGPAPAADLIRVGVLAAPGSANTSTTFIVDRTFHSVEFLFLIDGYDYPYQQIDQSFDVMFNSASDPDITGPLFAQSLRIAERLTLPMLNPPRVIAETTRERMAVTLAGIPNCVMPETILSARAEVRGQQMDYPYLIRPIGSHGGTSIAKIESEGALQAYLGEVSAESFYLTRFVDFQAADGRYRKYRLIFVGGEILPYHLAIGEHWLVHYFRTDMAAQPALREEEARFLADPFGELGEGPSEALREIVARVPLDYFGIDCSIDRDGKLLVFECNATMLVHDHDEQATFAYKKAATLAIRDAVTRLIAKRKR